MKHQWLAYLIVAFLSIGAGVAIAGLPDNASVDATIVVTTTSEAPASTVPATSEPVSSTVVETTDPTTTSSTPATSTTVPPTTTVETGALPDRADIVAITANGTGQAGVAAANAARLQAVGYTNVQPRDGTDVVDLTVVYYAEGFEEAATRMATDLDLLPFFISPLEEAPAVLALPDDAQLVAYIGLDRA